MSQNKLKCRRCSMNLLVGVLAMVFALSYLGVRIKIQIKEMQYDYDESVEGWHGYFNSLNVSNTIEVTASPSHEEINDPPIKILSWTPLNMRTKEDEENWFPQGFEVCRKHFPVPWTPCEYTTNRSMLQESDAILFRARRIDVNRLPPTRTPKQKWLFYEFEPPYKVWMYTNLTLLKDSFNVTATYSRDSDIYKNGFLRKCWHDPGKKSRLIRDLDTTDFASKKHGLVAWFVSVCNTQSKREKYVKQLQKHIPVDVYGECGNLKCGSSMQKTWETAECDRRLLHNNGSYKFYLAFENSLCDDYVTEKLWKLLDYKVVPIVMGAVDYANMRPKDSFIDVRDFESPKALAKFLQYLDKNSTAYNEYVMNKLSLKCRQIETKVPWHCRVCNYLKENKKQIDTVHDIARFWGMKRCERPEEFFNFKKDDDFAIR